MGRAREIFPTVVILWKKNGVFDENSQKFLESFNVVVDEYRFAQGWQVFCLCGRMTKTTSHFYPAKRSSCW